VANAVLHAHSEVDLRLCRTGSGIRIEVADHDPHPVLPRRPGPEDSGGRGLYLVGVLARDWGVRSSPPGKTVWFELSQLSQVSRTARRVPTATTRPPRRRRAAMAGEIDEAKGRMKEAVGDLTDDEGLKREGKVDRAAGRAKDKMDDLKDKAGDAVDNIRDKAKDHL
jgi:uncharacterized protein YjbJ (UPF0337 family)